jgi:hypothetical protein
MSELALPCFTLAVFLANLLPLLLLTRPPLEEGDDELPPESEPVRYDHVLTLDRIWHTFGTPTDLPQPPRRTHHGEPWWAKEESIAWATEEI